MKNIGKFENWIGDPKDLIDEFIKDSKVEPKKAKETIDRLAKELLEKKNKNNNKNDNMNANELVKYKPYTIGRYNNGYADICFGQDGLMTVPKASAQTIVDLLNEAFKNGVKMALSKNSGQISVPAPEPAVKARPMPVEEPHPINSFTKKK